MQGAFHEETPSVFSAGYHALSFSDLLDSDPEYAAKLLPILHKDGQEDGPINRRNYANELANSKPTSAQWDAMFRAGHLNNLVDIAAEENLYKLVVPGPRKRSIHKPNVEYIASILLSLFPATLELYLLSIDPLRSATHVDTIEQFLAKLPKLWITWWNNVDTFLTLLEDDLRPEMDFLTKEAGEEGDFFLGVIGHTIKVCMRIYIQRWNRLPPLNQRVAHLSLVSWALVRGPPIRNRELLGTIHQIIAGDPSCSNPSLHLSNITALFKDTISDHVGAERLARALYRDLNDEAVLDVHLHSLMNIFCLVVYHHPSATNLSIKKRCLVQYAVAACARQLCMGAEEWNYGTVRLGLIGVRGKLLDTDNTLKDDLQADFHIALTLALLSRVITPALERRDKELVEAMCDVMSAFSVLAKMLQASPRTNRDNRSASSPFQRLLRHVQPRWLTVLDTLRAASVEPDDLKRQLASCWVRFGRDFGLDEAAERRRCDRSPPPTATAHPPACHDAVCLCSEVKPLHNVHVCKGCWGVFYCGKRCQTRDWQEGGHREHCAGRRASNHASASYG